jgi:hypothetical protein
VSRLARYTYRLSLRSRSVSFCTSSVMEFRCPLRARSGREDPRTTYEGEYDDRNAFAQH